MHPWTFMVIVLIIIPSCSALPPCPAAYVLVKDGVRLDQVQSEMCRVYPEARKIWAKQGATLIITSGTEGRHKVDSLHYTGYALDLRHWHLRDKATAARSLQEALGSSYRVIRERTHIHVEYTGVR